MAGTLLYGSIAAAQVNGTWAAPFNSGTWSNAAYWSSNPLFPSSAGDVANFDSEAPSSLSQSPDSATVSLVAPISLDRISFDGTRRYFITSIGAGSITLTGAAEIDAHHGRLGTPDFPYAGAQELQTSLFGSNGLTKLGDGFVDCGGLLYSGPTRVLGGALMQTRFPAMSSGLSLDNGATWICNYAQASGIPSLDVGAGGGTILTIKSNPAITSNGSITISAMTGSGPLALSHTGVVNLSGTIATVRTILDSTASTSFSAYTGAMEVGPLGMLELRTQTRLNNMSSLRIAGGSVQLFDSSTSAWLRLGSVPVTLSGGTFGTSTTIATAQESTGTMTLEAGSNNIIITRSVSVMGSSLTASTLVRGSAATMYLGYTNDVSTAGGFFLGSGTPTMIGGGGTSGASRSIVPWMCGVLGLSSGSPSFAVGMVTYTNDGLRPLSSTEYETALPATSATRNVRLTGANTLNSATTINSLGLLGSGTSNVSLSGSGTLTVTSGAITLGSTSGTFTDSIGSISVAHLNFGPAEGIIHAYGSALITSSIDGIAGLTLSGPGTLRLVDTSNYTGTTTIAATKVLVTSSVTSGVAGNLGAGTSAIVMAPGASNGGASMLAYDNTISTFNRDIIVRGAGGQIPAHSTIGGDATFPVNNLSTQIVTYNGNIQVDGGAVLSVVGASYGSTRFNGNAPPTKINGNISGDGRLVIDAVAVGTFIPRDVKSAVALNGNNSYTGGTEIRAPLVIGSDTALGTGPVWIERDQSQLSTHISATATRTLPNGLIFADLAGSASDADVMGELIIDGSFPISFTGPVNLNSAGSITVNAPSASLTGEISGGALYAYGNRLSITRARIPKLQGDRIKILPNGTDAATSKVRSLSVSSLDLSDNKFIVDTTGAPNLNSTRTALLNGSIFSSLANATKKVGYADNAVLGLATFGGLPVDATSLLLKFTFAGDTNLDGQVDVTDLGALATNWQTNNVWTGGDFNYDGFVDVTDLGALATNWQAGVGNPLAPSRLDEALAAVGLTAIPEPASSLLTIASTLLIARRKRF